MIKEKLQKVNLKNETFLNFFVNQKKSIVSIFKDLFGSSSVLKEMHRSIRPGATRPGTMYGICIARKQQVDG